MKYNNILIVIWTLSLLVIACSPSATDSNSDLEGLRSLLKEKKTALSTLQDEVRELSNQISELVPSLQEKAKLVETLDVSTGVFERFINIQGKVVADDFANVTSEVPGRITMLRVKEGDFVKKGQLIATIDMESIDKQEAEVLSALSLAKDVYERQSRLWDQKIGSEVQFLQSKNNVERLEKSLETLQFQKTKANIYAPISGAVDMEFLKQGEVVNPGTPIVQILNTYKLKVNTDLPERYLKIIRKGMNVDMIFPSVDIEMKGRVSLLGRSINPSNRTLKVEILPSKRSSLLKPNLLAEIKLKEFTMKDVVSIPLIYILQEVDGKEFVYVIDKSNEEHRAKKVYITTSEVAEGEVIVDQGLTVGDALITQGARNVSDGELVKTQ